MRANSVIERTACTPPLIGLGLLIVMLSMLGFIGWRVKKRLIKLRAEDEQ